jgi:chromosome segregation ATPase
VRFKQFSPIVSDIKKNLQNRIEEESRLSQRIDSLGTYFEEVKSSFKGLPQEIKRTADDIQLSNKRIADIQVETTTLRKRLDEERNHNEINIGGLQKIEASLKSVLSQEAERKQAQIAFIEKASLAQVERDNTWKAWQEQVNSISGLGDDYSQKILALEATHKAIKQSLSELDQVNSRFDRRINELTEMHRLNEERFRQEWISFKSDDQKRWTNYQLTQEEQQQEDLRQFAKQAERITPIEDDLKDTKESITLINEETEKQLKVFYSAFHDLIESFDQTFSK